MNKFPEHRIIFKGELDFVEANAYLVQTAALIEPSRYKTEGVVFISEEEVKSLNQRIKDLEDILQVVVSRHDNCGSIMDFGVSPGIAAICRNALKK